MFKHELPAFGPTSVPSQGPKDNVSERTLKNISAIERAREELIIPWSASLRLIDPNAKVLVSGSINAATPGRVADLDVLIISEAIQNPEMYRLLLLRLAADAADFTGQTKGALRPVFYTRRAIESGYVERARGEAGLQSTIVPIHLLWYQSFEEFHRRDGAIAESLLTKVKVLSEPDFPWKEFGSIPQFNRNGKPEWCPAELLKFAAFEQNRTSNYWATLLGDVKKPESQLNFRWDVERACAEYWANSNLVQNSFSTIQVLDYLRVAIRKAGDSFQSDPELILKEMDPEGQFKLLDVYRAVEPIREGVLPVDPQLVETYLHALLTFTSSNTTTLTVADEAKRTLSTVFSEELAARTQRQSVEHAAFIENDRFSAAEIEDRMRLADISSRRALVAAMVNKDQTSPSLMAGFTAALKDSDPTVRTWGLAGYWKHGATSTVSLDPILSFAKSELILDAVLGFQTLARFSPWPNQKPQVAEVVGVGLGRDFPIVEAAFLAADAFDVKRTVEIPTIVKSLPATPAIRPYPKPSETNCDFMWRAIAAAANRSNCEALPTLLKVIGDVSWRRGLVPHGEPITRENIPGDIDINFPWELLSTAINHEALRTARSLGTKPGDVTQIIYESRLLATLAERLLEGALREGHFTEAGDLICAGVGNPSTQFTDAFNHGLARLKESTTQLTSSWQSGSSSLYEKIAAEFSNGPVLPDEELRFCVGQAISRLETDPPAIALPLTKLLHNLDDRYPNVPVIAAELLSHIVGRPIAPLGEIEQKIMRGFADQRAFRELDDLYRNPEKEGQRRVNFLNHFKKSAGTQNSSRNVALLLCAAASLDSGFCFSLLSDISYGYYSQSDGTNEALAVILMRPDVQPRYFDETGHFSNAALWQMIWKALDMADPFNSLLIDRVKRLRTSEDGWLVERANIFLARSNS